MVINGLASFIITTLLCILCSYYIVHQPISCIISGASTEGTNGFYAALGGIYIKIGYEVVAIPDIFDIVRLLKSTKTGFSIIQSPQKWLINSNFNRKVAYSNSPSDPAAYIDKPPEYGWHAAGRAGNIPEDSPAVHDCIGSLQDSPPLSRVNENSNVGQLMQRPVTAVLLGAILACAYFLWARRIEVSAVSYSYETFWLQRQYWRAVSASFAHFDVLHLGFNTMALYQLGELEMVYGSMTFLYLSAGLVVLTMLIVTALYHLLITRFGRVELISQQAVGYSCVLFAWMVALSVRLRQYCPLFILPSFCIDTWFIPLPNAFAQLWGIQNIPINLGPFVLLIFTKIIMPRSSFTGHLAGIIIGYPLAWNMLTWLTPPVLLSLLVAVYIASEQAFVWSYPGFQSSFSVDLSEFIATPLRRNYHTLRMLVLLYVVGIVGPSAYYIGWIQLLPRAAACYLLWASAQACRIEWVTSLHALRLSCAKLMVVAMVFLAAMALYDLCNLTAVMTSKMLLVGCSLDEGFLTRGTILLAGAVIVEMGAACLLLVNLQEVKAAHPCLEVLRCSTAHVGTDLQTLHLSRCTYYFSRNRVGGDGVSGVHFPPFAGRANRLGDAATNAYMPTTATSASVTSATPDSNISTHYV